MAEQNPARNVAKLRLESGEELVASATGITENTDGSDSSYPLGISTMRTGVSIGQAVDDWQTANGIITNQKIDSDFMTQTYQPTGAEVDYILQRQWDDTPISFNDDFSATLNNYRWKVDAGTVNILGGQMNVTSGAKVFTNWRFENGANAWEIQFDLDIGNSSDSDGIYIECVPSSYRFSGSYLMGTHVTVDSTNINFGTRGSGSGTPTTKDSGVVRLKLNHNTSGQYQWSWSKNGGVDWTIAMSYRTMTFESFGQNPCYIKFWGFNSNFLADNFEVVSGDTNITAYGDAGSAWSSWRMIKDSTVTQGISGTFTTVDGKTITVTDGSITNIV